MVTKLATLVDFGEKIIPIAVCVKVKLLVLLSVLSTQYRYEPLLDNFQSRNSGCQ